MLSAMEYTRVFVYCPRGGRQAVGVLLADSMNVFIKDEDLLF